MEKIIRPVEMTVTKLFENQLQQAAGKIALVDGNRQLTYTQLNEYSNRVAYCLQKKYGVTRGNIIAIAGDRSDTLITGLLGILKSGAAFVFIDHSFSLYRIVQILGDCKPVLVLGAAKLPAGIDSELPFVSVESLISDDMGVPCPDNVSIEDVCCLMYPSAAIDNVSAVMLSHANLVSFFQGINAKLALNENDCLLSIVNSPIELLWPICNGIQLVLHAPNVSENSLDNYVTKENVQVDFSLFFFANYNIGVNEKYSLLLKAAKYADEHGFKAVWTPERHFHHFGALFPNPSVVSAALAMVTSKTELRCGSVVSPLHNTIRIVEEWAVVDNLSGGRVALSFAPGWNINDFALAPESYDDRHNIMYRQIEMVQQLWRGGSLNNESLNATVFIG